MKHIVMFSGGIGSWGAARAVAARHGTEHLTLLFSDTLIEDEDLYRFIDQAAASIGGRFVKIADGRTPWEVFKAERFIGNSLVDPCSKILKRNLMRKWLEDNCDPRDTTVYLGIDWTEIHRIERASERWSPWNVQAPLCEKPYYSKSELLAQLNEAGIEPPRLYSMGFPHNNCGGFCVKAGQAHFRRLLKEFPERYLEHERKEQELREFLNRDVSIMKDRTGGKTKPLSMRQFRERLLVSDGSDFDAFEWGGCGCAVD